MKVGLINISFKGDNKDYNAGLGTHFDAGPGILGRYLTSFIHRNDNLPLHAYALLNAILKQNNHEVVVITKLSNEDIDLYILHASMVRYKEEKALIKLIKANSNAKICVIGPLMKGLSSNYNNVADTVIIGEWEMVFQNMISINDIKDGTILGTKIVNLDILPFPDWSLYNINKTNQHPFLTNKPIVTIQASRRCPFKCNYCPYIIEGNDFNQRSVENVIAEIKYLQKEYDIRSLVFRDPIFSYRKPWVKKFAQTIIKENIKIEFVIETRSDFLTNEMINLLHLAGLRAIKLGIESTDYQQLNLHKRKVPKRDQLIKIVKYAESKKIIIIALYVLGLPEDTIDSIKNTVDFAKKLNTRVSNFTLCTPLPGTEFFELKEKDLYESNYNKYDNYHTTFKLKNINNQKLQRIRRQAQISYYFRLSYLIKHYIH